MLERCTKPSVYGYWVAPTGEIYALDGWQRHWAKAKDICRHFKLNIDDAFGTLLDLHWIDITLNQNSETPSFELPPDMGSAQMKAILQIFRWHKDMSFFIDKYAFNDGLAAAAYVRNCLKRNLNPGETDD